MFKKGDYVVKANNGVCYIEGTEILEVSGCPKEYFVIRPITDQGAKIFVSLAKAEEQLRYVISKDGAIELIKSMPSIDSIEIKDNRMREQAYREALKSSVPEKIVSVIKELYLRRAKREEEGKKATSTDEKYFRLAKDMLYTELSFALGKEKSEMEDFISNVISA